MLRGKIDKNGFLFIDRGMPELTRAMCPHNQKACSHDCALFGAPSGATVTHESKKRYYTAIKLCGNALWFSELTDERGTV